MSNNNLNNYFGPVISGWKLQASGNIFMDNVIHFHNIVLCVLLCILFIVTWFLITVLVDFGNTKLRLKFYLFLNKNLIKVLKKVDKYYLLSIIINIKVNKVFGSINDILISLKNQINCGMFFTKDNEILILLDFLKNVIHTYGTDRYYNKFLKFVNLSQINPYILYNKNEFEFFYVEKNFNKIIIIDNLNTFKKYYGIQYRYYFYSDAILEFLWTLFPSIILLFLAIPSFGLLYSVEKVALPELTVKVIGHQWYWEYMYSDYMSIDYKYYINKNNKSYEVMFSSKLEDNYIIESYMINDEDLPLGGLRLLEVDNKIMLPINTSIRLLITSDDVLHSWAVPALGIKMDACPGRLNEIIINIREIGFYYGQCSELCGWYHGFMPISIQSLQPEDFRYWAISKFAVVKLKEFTNKIN
jgi:heme/copper-type cytochrome/quinol oxidase subunit 2